MRGKHFCSVWEESRYRITPACAGKTSGKGSKYFQNEDHPRVCGENTRRLLTSTYSGGSPPRVRGKRIFRHVDLLADRITPACAGKTVAYGKNQGSFKDHPRVCGENVEFYENLKPDEGSPPRVRGKLSILFYSIFPVGITPACAGKTNSDGHGITWNKDHPRVCGENENYRQTETVARGSPPRVRGKQYCAVGLIEPLRITPACAGKTNERR